MPALTDALAAQARYYADFQADSHFATASAVRKFVVIGQLDEHADPVTAPLATLVSLEGGRATASVADANHSAAQAQAIGIAAAILAVLAGLAFTWWGRVHLGRLWSSAITRKEGHRVIDTGPYGLVRHPIYTGLIGAMLATGIAVATATALLGTVLIAFGLWQKARMEEGFLTAELGADAYGPYCRRVPMLVPFLPQR